MGNRVRQYHLIKMLGLAILTLARFGGDRFRLSFKLVKLVLWDAERA